MDIIFLYKPSSILRIDNSNSNLGDMSVIKTMFNRDFIYLHDLNMKFYLIKRVVKSYGSVQVDKV